VSAIIVPPIRSPLTDPGPDSAKGHAGRTAAQRTAIQTATRDWYLFFEKLSRGLARLNSSVNEGTHEERLALLPGNAPDGALWVETDRGNVVYQVQIDADGEPQWVYLAGAMSGTLTPDERPTDLGDLDAGFQFAAADTGQTFQWSGTAWVDITPAPPEENSVEVAYASAPVTLTPDAQDVPGCALTAARAGRYLVTACFDFINNDTGFACIGTLEGETSVALLTSYASDPLEATVSQQWVVDVEADHTFQLIAWKTVATVGGSSVSTQSSISATWIAPS
jgi:hypothetical protein